ncbi:hypothetical protein [Bradyrhizobium sp. 195]|uniref:hypothetical protein n=1 Tax=Bradyrhizobium sp. 195 TaxID=2782662 RepID=UPI0020015025|nr:hypothetical protein [Bradyrhizobium sp. 195]UPK31139.1 hypothetical protein IVB26_38935 [Bradyrhizobium sp. 195]
MARPIRVPYLVTGANEYGCANHGRGSATLALRLARKLLGDGYMDVRVCTPRGRVLQSDELDELKLKTNLKKRPTWPRDSNAAIARPRNGKRRTRR